MIGETRKDVESKVKSEYREVQEELLEKYTVKILFRWNNRKFKDKYLKKLERSQ